jgi:hypothetical protein
LVIKLSDKIERNVAGKIIATQWSEREQPWRQIIDNLSIQKPGRFQSRIGVVLEEAEESALWLGLHLAHNSR